MILGSKLENIKLNLAWRKKLNFCADVFQKSMREIVK